jgi:hypothetical protein
VRAAAPGGIREVIVTARVLRADGTVKADLGRIGHYKRSWLRGAIERIKTWLPW